ncbi:MAG: precorrin-4 C(11)-methyltransferase [Treponema sp.]|jgi:precorrin-4/cobalt-precorrin-4 C11-methyltransferase|nr:precorrin-4 C(11)-methyltransferase [Treponema sp.]
MIYFVGAGPGAADLITLRGKKLLEEADQIIYAGSLVNPDLLGWAKPECVLHNSASMTLEEVTECFITGEQKHWLTLRLHTGDPSIYGAIREQMDRLKTLGFNYEVVPGVSSLSAAAAALRAEYTLPGVSQTLIVTRTAGRTAMPEKEGLASLAAHQASMAVFLSAGLLETLQQELLRGGYIPATPAAIVYKASWPDEKIIRCALGDIAARAAEAGINRTALVLVGGFLGQDYERSKLYDPGFTHGYRQGGK